VGALLRRRFRRRPEDDPDRARPAADRGRN
jgi:hypothetical protein